MPSLCTVAQGLTEQDPCRGQVLGQPMFCLVKTGTLGELGREAALVECREEPFLGIPGCEGGAEFEHSATFSASRSLRSLSLIGLG